MTKNAYIFYDKLILSNKIERVKNWQGKVFKYGDNIDTDLIIPARYLNTSDPNELKNIVWRK